MPGPWLLALLLLPAWRHGACDSSSVASATGSVGPASVLADLLADVQFDYTAKIWKSGYHESLGIAGCNLQHHALHMVGKVAHKASPSMGNFSVELVALGAGTPNDGVFLRAKLNGDTSCSNFSYPELVSEQQKAKLRRAAQVQNFTYIGEEQLTGTAAPSLVFETDLLRSRVLRLWLSKTKILEQVEVRRVESRSAGATHPWSLQDTTASTATETLRQVLISNMEENPKMEPTALRGWDCAESTKVLVGLGIDRFSMQSPATSSLQMQEALYALRELADEYPTFAATQVLATLGDLAIHLAPARSPFETLGNQLSFDYSIAHWSEAPPYQWRGGMHQKSGSFDATLDKNSMRLSLGDDTVNSLRIKVFVEESSITVWIRANEPQDNPAEDCIILPVQAAGAPLEDHGKCLGMDALGLTECSVWAFGPAADQETFNLWYDGEQDEVRKMEMQLLQPTMRSMTLDVGGWSSQRPPSEEKPPDICRPLTSEVMLGRKATISTGDADPSGRPTELRQITDVARILSGISLIGREVTETLEGLSWRVTNTDTPGSSPTTTSLPPPDFTSVLSTDLTQYAFTFESIQEALDSSGNLLLSKSTGKLSVDLQSKGLSMTAEMGPDIRTTLLASLGPGDAVLVATTSVGNARSCWVGHGGTGVEQELSSKDALNPFTMAKPMGKAPPVKGSDQATLVYFLPISKKEALFLRVGQQGDLLNMMFQSSEERAQVDIRVANWTTNPKEGVAAGGDMATILREIATANGDMQCNRQDDVEDLYQWPLLRIALGASKDPSLHRVTS